MSGSTGERPFGDIVTSIRYWIIHSITIPMLFIAAGIVYSQRGIPELRPYEWIPVAIFIGLLVWFSFPNRGDNSGVHEDARDSIAFRGGQLFKRMIRR